MTRPNGHDRSTNPGAMPELVLPPDIGGIAEAPGEKPTATELPTRSKQRMRQQIRQNRFVILGGGAVVLALMIFVATSIPHKNKPPKSTTANSALQTNPPAEDSTAAEKSLFPITDSGRPPAKTSPDGYVNEQDLERTVKRMPISDMASRTQASRPGTLGSIPPFGEQPWQAPPYQPGASNTAAAGLMDVTKEEREQRDRPSLVYVHKTSNINPAGSNFSTPAPQTGLGLEIGTRLRARLESALSTAVRTPVVAVIEYNYERDGEIIVPAGSKAVGQIQEADRSGFVRIQFDSLLTPDGANISIQAGATDLELRPLRGKVEGKNTGKNVLVRALSGIGQAGAILAGRSSLNQSLSESDLMRERISNNIGEASDEEISRMAVTERIVVSIPADTPIYLVLEQTAKEKLNSGTSEPHQSQTPPPKSAEELRQLLQLQRELNQSASTQVTN